MKKVVKIDLNGLEEMTESFFNNSMNEFDSNDLRFKSIGIINRKNHEDLGEIVSLEFSFNNSELQNTNHFTKKELKEIITWTNNLDSILEDPMDDFDTPLPQIIFSFFECIRITKRGKVDISDPQGDEMKSIVYIFCDKI